MIALGLVQPLALLALLTFTQGLLTDLYRPAVSAAIADLVPPEERPRAYGYLYWAINLGFAIAAVVAGLIAASTTSCCSSAMPSRPSSSA